MFGTWASPPIWRRARPPPRAATYSHVRGESRGGWQHGRHLFDGSVTITNYDANAWWQVDLGASATVSSIVIWDRTDCCSSCLSDYWVFVSDTPFSADRHARHASEPGRDLEQPSDRGAQPFDHHYGQRCARPLCAGAAHAAPTIWSWPRCRYSAVWSRTWRREGSNPEQHTPRRVASLGGGRQYGRQYFDGSVSIANYGANAWWQVDLGASANRQFHRDLGTGPTVAAVV